MKTKTFFVYKHTSPSGKVYIGITCQKPERRWNYGNGYKESCLFYNAIQKYGWDNIKHEILFDGLTEQEAKNMEIELIAKYQSNDREFGYNITCGGDGSLGRLHTEEAKTKISKANKGRIPNKETREKMSKSQKGRKHSDSTKNVISKKLVGNNNQKTRKVVQLNKETEEVIMVWDRIIDAVRSFGKTKNGSILSVLNGKTKTAHGYKWIYYDDYIKLNNTQLK